MGKFITKFQNHTEYGSAEANLVLPNVSLCVQEGDVHYNPYEHSYSQDYLTFVALEDGTFQLSTNAVSYSLDNGETWTSLEAATSTPTVTAGSKIMWKGELTPVAEYGIGIFSSTCNFNVEGNAMSLLFGDNFVVQNDLTSKDYAFYYLFSGCTKFINAENLILPATTLADHCYEGMFYGCTNLTTVPKLPATTLAVCCYQYMFYGCTNLTTVPELLATTLAQSCYEGIFRGCTSLTTAPELLATTLAQYCYSSMFYGCTALTTAPELPATTLVQGCYNSMFRGCTNLNYIKAMFTTTPSTTYTQNWVNNVASSGTFVKNSAATWTTTGVNGVPSGWTVQTASN